MPVECNQCHKRVPMGEAEIPTLGWLCRDCLDTRGSEEWISVTQRLPEPKVSVLVWDGEDQITAYLSGRSGYGVPEHDWLPIPYNELTTWSANVTHWMPLPAPPTREV